MFPVTHANKTNQMFFSMFTFGLSCFVNWSSSQRTFRPAEVVTPRRAAQKTPVEEHVARLTDELLDEQSVSAETDGTGRLSS